MRSQLSLTVGRDTGFSVLPVPGEGALSMHAHRGL